MLPLNVQPAATSGWIIVIIWGYTNSQVLPHFFWILSAWRHNESFYTVRTETRGFAEVVCGPHLCKVSALERKTSQCDFSDFQLNPVSATMSTKVICLSVWEDLRQCTRKNIQDSFVPLGGVSVNKPVCNSLNVCGRQSSVRCGANKQLDAVSIYTQSYITADSVCGIFD